MLTRCPKCHTLFRISETQLRQARGKTRCGQCYTVFEAKEAIVDEQVKLPAPATPGPAVAGPPAAENHNMGDAASSIYNELVIKNRSVKYDIPDVDDDTPAAPPPVQPAAPASQNSQTAMRRIQELKRRADANQIQPQMTKQLNDQRQSSMRHASDQGHDIRFVPDVLQDDLYEEVHIPSAKSNFFTVLAIILLLFTLLGQYIYFMRDTLAENPQIRPHIVKFCKVFDCVVPFRKDLKKIVNRTFVFEQHPKNRRIGLLQARFQNIAKHTQPFPVVEIRVINTAKGTVVGMIRLKPTDYLPRYINPNAGFRSGVYVDLKRRFVMPNDEPSSVSIDFR